MMMSCMVVVAVVDDDGAVDDDDDEVWNLLMSRPDLHEHLLPTEIRNGQEKLAHNYVLLLLLLLLKSLKV